MKIQARNPEHRTRYSVFLDGIDVSTVVKEADDVANVVIVVIRDPQGQLVRREDGQVLTAAIAGHVSIVSQVTPLERMP